MIMTTKECNLRCKYCYEKNKTARRMSIETAKDVIDFLFSDKYHKKYDNIQLGLIGGEVFENLSTLNFILFYALKKMKLTKKWNKLQFHICTNGTFFSNKKVQELILRYNKWLYLSVSLDGCKTIHDMNRCNSYDTITTSVPFLKK